MPESKSDLRKLMRDKRMLVSENEHQTQGLTLLRQLRPLLDLATNVAVYHALGREMSLLPVIEYCFLHKISVVKPIAIKDSRIMRFETIVDIDNANVNIFYPAEYQLINEMERSNIDLVLLPLLAIDQHGFRLGQGGGYYDTTFANCSDRPILCGVGYDWQLCEEVPHDGWDLQLDYFASDKRLIKFTK